MVIQQALELDTVREGATITHRIVLPFLPPSKNVYDGWPWQWQSGTKKKWIRAILAAVEEQGMPLDVPKIGLAAKLVFPTRQRRDPQNYSNCLWNFVPDGLVKAGVISDDKAGKIDFGPNLSITMAVDDRKAVPKTHRRRTIIAVSFIGAVPR